MLLAPKLIGLADSDCRLKKLDPSNLYFCWLFLPMNFGSEGSSKYTHTSTFGPQFSHPRTTSYEENQGSCPTSQTSRQRIGLERIRPRESLPPSSSFDPASSRQGRTLIDPKQLLEPIWPSVWNQEAVDSCWIGVWEPFRSSARSVWRTCENQAGTRWIDALANITG